MGLRKATLFARWPGIATPAAAIAVTSLALQLGGQPVRDALMYDRPRIAAGEIYRLVTGHLVHLDWRHLLLNLAGLMLVAIVVGRQYRWPQWLLVAAASAALIDGAFWLFIPDLRWYVGLSGVLHGLLVAGAIGSYRQRRTESLVLLVAVALKLGYESQFGPMPGSADTVSGTVITEAHLFGAVGGLIAALAILAMTNRSRPSTR